MLGCPGVHDLQSRDSINFMISNLKMDLSEPEAFAHITSLVYLSLGSTSTTLNFLMHSINQSLTSSQPSAGAELIEADEVHKFKQNRLKESKKSTEEIKTSTGSNLVFSCQTKDEDFLLFIHKTTGPIPKSYFIRLDNGDSKSETKTLNTSSINLLLKVKTSNNLKISLIDNSSWNFKKSTISEIQFSQQVQKFSSYLTFKL